MNNCLNCLTTLLLLCWNLLATNAKTDEMRDRYRHPLWKTAGAIAKKVGGHGGMDFLMDLRILKARTSSSPSLAPRFRDGMLLEKTAMTSNSSKPSSTMWQLTSPLTESASIAVDSPMVA